MHFRASNGMPLVTDADSAARAECDRYRAMASDTRALIPTRLAESTGVVTPPPQET